MPNLEDSETPKTTAYVEHPCSKKEKLKYRKKFDRVIDARFAPDKLADGDKVFMKPKPKTEKAEKPKTEK